MREEFLELLEIWDHVREFKLNQCHGLPNAEALIPTSQALLDRFDSGPGTPSQQLSALKGTLQETSVGLAEGLKNNEQTSQDFFTYYKKVRGMDFFADCDNQKPQIKAILERGYLNDENEFYLIKMCLDDTLSAIPPKKTAIAEKMLHEFERNASSRLK